MNFFSKTHLFCTFLCSEKKNHSLVLLLLIWKCLQKKNVLSIDMVWLSTEFEGFSITFTSPFMSVARHTVDSILKGEYFLFWKKKSLLYGWSESAIWCGFLRKKYWFQFPVSKNENVWKSANIKLNQMQSKHITVSDSHQYYFLMFSF